MAALIETTDADSSISTIYTMTDNDTFSGTVTNDEDWIKVTIPAGEEWTFTLTVTSGTFDPTSRIYDGSGNFVADENSFTATTSTLIIANNTASSADYYYSAFDFNFDEAGGYLISVTSQAAPVLTEWTNEEIADQLTAGYWNYSNGNYASWDAVPGDIITVDLTRLTADGRALAISALEAWTFSIGLTFDIITDPLEALTENASGYAVEGLSIIFDDDESGAFSNFTTSGTHTAADGGTAYTINNALVNVSTAWLASSGTDLDTYSFQTYIHEIGHALGLGHAGGYNGSATYPAGADYLNDSWQATIMSYFSQTDNSYIDATYAYIITPMMADIRAMQNLYGVDGAIRFGDTTYGFNSNAGGYYDLFSTLVNPVSFTIIDDGGNDTIDLSLLTMNSNINLAGGSISDVGGGIGNMSIYTTTIIENIILGSGDDTVLGNGYANSIVGGDGNDTIDGRQGNDSLFGGDGDDVIGGWTGNDYIDGGAGIDTLDLTGFGSAITVSLLVTSAQFLSVAAGYDTIINMENVEGSIGGDYILGSNGVNVIDGNNGNDRLFGLGGNDFLIGGIGNDILRGGSGNDVITGGSGRDYMSGSSGVDIFVFNSITESVASGFRDRIQAFVSGEDKVDLSGIDAILGGGDDAFTWIGTAGFGSAGAGALRYRYIEATNKIILEADIDGDNIRDFSIEFQGISTLDAGDFIL